MLDMVRREARIEAVRRAHHEFSVNAFAREQRAKGFMLRILTSGQSTM